MWSTSQQLRSCASIIIINFKSTKTSKLYKEHIKKLDNRVKHHKTHDFIVYMKDCMLIECIMKDIQAPEIHTFPFWSCDGCWRALGRKLLEYKSSIMDDFLQVLRQKRHGSNHQIWTVQTRQHLYETRLKKRCIKNHLMPREHTNQITILYKETS